MKLFVTGGAGFIGSNFILYWIKKYPMDQIINFDKLTYAGNLRNLKEVENNSNYTFIHGDICDKPLVDKSLQGVDTIVHFAAESHVDRSILEPASFIITNVTGTQTLLDSAVRAGVKRFHHVSTDEVFGALNLNDTRKFNEDTNYNPRSPYSASKAASDHLVRAYHMTYGLPVTITNCSNNYGPFMFPEKLIPLAITNLLEDKKVPVYGDGLYVRDWLYVEDHCSAIDAVLHKGRIGESYCVGGLTEDINNLEILTKICNILGKSEDMIVFVEDRMGHDRRYAVDWSKIKKELGWEPAHGLDQWLEYTVEWYKKNKDWWTEIKLGTYKDYYKKQYAKLE